GTRPNAFDVSVDELCPRKAAFDRNRPIAVMNYQVLKESISEKQNLFGAVQCFTQAEELNRRAERVDDAIDGRFEVTAELERKSPGSRGEPVGQEHSCLVGKNQLLLVRQLKHQAIRANRVAVSGPYPNRARRDPCGRLCPKRD